MTRKAKVIPARRSNGRPARSARAQAADRLHSLAIHILRRVRRVDELSGLSGPRLSALSVIVFGGVDTIGALAAAERVKPPTMTRLVQAMEADGLVRRESDPVDARVVRVRATAAGARVLQEGRERRVASLSALLEPLSSAELASVGRAIAILEPLVSKPDAAGTPRARAG
ncbi:MAG TPA: MarR family transcriptional regulator [Gemmatimonadaceae bacterium]|nr:MarR family transcriptional regulator [Gemmatimonadaceae bacterium]